MSETATKEDPIWLGIHESTGRVVRLRESALKVEVRGSKHSRRINWASGEFTLDGWTFTRTNET